MHPNAPYCIKAPTKQALGKGASKKEITEAIWAAAEMCGSAAYAHAAIVMAEMEKHS